MTYEEVHGFKTYQKIDGREFLLIESDHFADCLDFFNKHPSYNVAVSRYHGYKDDNLEFLKNTPSIDGVYIQDHLNDVSGLYYLKNLRWLLFSGSNNDLDLSRFQNLEVLRGEWSPKLKNIDNCKTLHHLALRKYKPKSKDLSMLEPLEQLVELEITQSPIESLVGIENLSRLERLALNYLSRLKDIAAVKELSSTLKVLRFDCCKAILDYNPIVSIAKLRELGINNCGKIDTIAFLRKLPELEHFSFVNTNVEDGDLTPCIEHPKLKHVGFMDKRHYSHKHDKIKEIIQNKHK